MITINVAFIAIFCASPEKILVISIPLIVFLARLNALYLSIERNYRCLHDQVRVRENTDFSMKPPKDGFGFFKALRSPSIYVTYLPVILVLTIIYYDFNNLDLSSQQCIGVTYQPKKSSLLLKKSKTPNRISLFISMYTMSHGTVQKPYQSAIGLMHM